MKNKVLSVVTVCLGLLLVGCSQGSKDVSTTERANNDTSKEQSEKVETKEKLDSNRIRIGTFNVASVLYPDFDAQNRLINGTKAEIVGLQELDKYTRRQNTDTIKDIAKNDFSQYKFAKAIDWEDQGEYGIGLISKYKIQDYDTGIYDETGEEDRAWQKMTFKTADDKKLSVYNTHLAFETIDIRKSQVSQLLNVVKEDPAEYKVLVGDFNMDQTHDEWDIFTDEGYKISNGKDDEWHGTFTWRDEEMNVFAVDNIITTDNIDIKRVNVTETPVSDHHMLYSDLVLD